MLKDFVTRVWHQARTIWRVASGAGVSRKNEGLDLFLAGQSVQKISALLLPGIGGPALVARQIEIQADIREYTLAREKEIGELKDEVADLRAALMQALKSGQPEQASDTTAPDTLLSSLLGLKI